MDDRVQAIIDGVAAGAADDAGVLDAGLLGGFLPIVVDAAASGRRLRRRELQACTEQGAAAAGAGVALRAVIDLYLSACWRLWEQLAQLPGSGVTGDGNQVRAAGLAVLRAADDAVAALAEGFQIARNDLARQQESTRQAVFEALLVGGETAAAVTGRVADLGVDLSSPHAVLVARHPRTFDDPSLRSAPRRLERALQGRHGDVYPLVAVKNGQLVCVFAAPDAESVSLVGRALTSVLAEIDPGGATWQAAVGRALRGAESVRVSHEQALSALDLATRLSLQAPVVNAADLAVFQVLLRDRAAIDDLVEIKLGPLSGARGRDDLLTTLEAYYSCGGVTTAAAARLHLSIRAVTYRLARIRALLGTDPTDPAQRFALHAAVLAARLTGWPRSR